MAALSFSDMQEIQKELQERYRDRWTKLTPQVGRDSLLWMMGEAGEVAEIIKKNGDAAIMEHAETRHHFIEELCDVLMYLNDVLLCYDITPEEISRIYIEKHKRNMQRW